MIKTITIKRFEYDIRLLLKLLLKKSSRKLTFYESTLGRRISVWIAFFLHSSLYFLYDRKQKNSFCPISSNGLFYTSVNMAHSASTFFPAVSFPFHLFFLHICEIHKSHLIWILFHIFLLYINGIEYQEFMYQGGNPKIMRLNLIKIFPERDCWWCIWFFLIQVEFHFFSILVFFPLLTSFYNFRGQLL